jgi:hypothetical protein
MIARLPLDIYLELKSFLSDLQYWRLLITSKRLLNDLGFISRRISLNEEQSKEILSSAKFRSLILGKIKNPKHQLKLFLSTNNAGFSSVGKISCALEIDFRFVADDVNWEILINNKSALCFKNYRAICQFPRVLGLERVDLTNLPRLRDVSLFSGLKQLALIDCPEIIDVKCLKELSRLTLSECPKVTDVSGLGKIRYLSLTKCRGIRDISAFTNNFWLTVFECGSAANVFSRNGMSKVPSVCNAVNLDCDWRDDHLSRITFP